MTIAKDNKQYYIPAGTLTNGAFDLDLTPDRAGWAWSGLKILSLSPGQTQEINSLEDEVIILSLEGSCDICTNNMVFTIEGRDNIWSAVSDYVYIPRDTTYSITSAKGGRFALASSRADNRLEPRYCPTIEVVSMLRGRGAMTRQINNYTIGNAFTPDHVLVTEVYTPGGGWSSYPPHKHEKDTDDERALEEIYYYEMRAMQEGREGFGFQRIYPSPDFDIDVCVEVHHGDTVIMPYGYHGPTMCAPGYDLYYLNVMAGPAQGAQWKVTFDDAHAWVNDAYEQAAYEHNPRLPFYPI
ncbi:MAG: 5-deoxy-glucuronate isomerase [Actinomycetaceae bacterium]|nr:5-deoxy-glucuronate isomerase [Actinomycetaceae bacterium]